ncbi:hypothetical protein A1S_3601 [Acinetobacter baumannii ATCC 17978]|nr:hypothetical protein A1S_3601 [Acinetobacter baumannii ATCC 17978]
MNEEGSVFHENLKYTAHSLQLIWSNLQINVSLTFDM